MGVQLGLLHAISKLLVDEACSFHHVFKISKSRGRRENSGRICLSFEGNEGLTHSVHGVCPL